MTAGLIAWFGASAAGVGSLIVLGGITRLTRSGLSMTDWKFTGERPPVDENDWQTEFEKYKLSPEFQKVNKSISLDEFKFIYWMEYAHRMWGRCLGFIFGLPAVYFFSKGVVTPKLRNRIGLLMLMGGTQGLVGWWMVRSGLKEREDNKVPRVSPYRLAAHLTSAVAIYSILLWTTFSLRRPTPILVSASEAVLSNSRSVKRWMVPLAGLITVTALSGAFVAGNDAGRSFNTFPTMNGAWIPEEYYDYPLFSKENLFEHTPSVQLHHRLLALCTLVGCLLIYNKFRRLDIHRTTKTYLTEMAGMSVVQVGLGIFALLTYVPTWLGSAHQTGAIVLLSIAMGTLHSLRPASPSIIAKTVSRLGPSVAALGVVGIGAAVTQIE